MQLFMKTKLLFLVLFVPLHAYLSLLALQRNFNPPPEGHGPFFQALSIMVTSPLLLPLVIFDPDGERLPKWIQFLSVPLNSLIWAMAVLFAARIIKRCRLNRHGGIMSF